MEPPPAFGDQGNEATE